MSGSDLCFPRNETARPHYFQNRITHSCICERFIFPRIGLPIMLQPNRQTNRSQVHGNWERGYRQACFIKLAHDPSAKQTSPPPLHPEFSCLFKVSVGKKTKDFHAFNPYISIAPNKPIMLSVYVTLLICEI